MSERAVDMPDDEYWAAFHEDVKAIRAKHRATGCRVFDEKLARCTCPLPSDPSS